MVLKPTFWRTVRAVMNETRLRLMRVVVEAEGRACVVEIAKSAGVDESLASICLRQLNARGLLGVRRERIKVLYNTESNRSLPESVAFQHALVSMLKGPLPKGWELDLIRKLKAFSHFNRLAIIVRLSKGPATIDDLYASIGVVVKSLYHHLRYLTGAGLVSSERCYGKGTVLRLVQPDHPVVKVMLDILVSDEEAAERYYNPGSMKIDGASRRVLRKIDRSEGHPKDWWTSPRPFSPPHGHLSLQNKRAMREGS